MRADVRSSSDALDDFTRKERKEPEDESLAFASTSASIHFRFSRVRETRDVLWSKVEGRIQSD